MNGPGGAELIAALGPTDRGVLWRATLDEPGDRILRLLDSSSCDERFRQALQRLQEQPRPNTAPIAGCGWYNDQFFIAYAVQAPTRTMQEVWAERTHWTARIRMLSQLCEHLPSWQWGARSSLGLSLRNIVATGVIPGELRLSLLACPAVVLEPPDDYAPLDGPSLAAIAPEVVRGIHPESRPQDQYALAALAALALGASPKQYAVEEMLEAQARGDLLAAEQFADVESFLRETAPVQELLAAIRHRRQTSPDARPAQVEDLLSAAVRAGDLIGLAAELLPDRVDEALQVLSWSGSANTGHRIECSRLAMRICKSLGDMNSAVGHLDEALRLAPFQVDLRRERCDALWALFVDTDEAVVFDRENDLMADLKFLKETDRSSDPAWYARTAEILRRRGDYQGEAEELYAACTLDGGNLPVLLRYVGCWLRLQSPDNAAAVCRMARQRIDAKEQAGVLSAEDAAGWRADFDEVCP